MIFIRRNFNNMNSDIKKWLQEISKDSLSRIGIKPGMSVLDFGAREGYNTLPAAKIVNYEGKIIAVDEDEKALNTLEEKVSKKSIDYIEIINNKGEPYFDINDNSIDFIILFDVFHELQEAEYIKEFQRILKNKGILSVFDPHVESIKGMKDKITSYNFSLKDNLKVELLHNYKLMKGEVNNFIYTI